MHFSIPFSVFLLSRLGIVTTPQAVLARPSSEMLLSKPEISEEKLYDNPKLRLMKVPLYRTTTQHQTAPIPFSADRDFSCSPLTHGLTPEDCSYMASIGMHSQGVNSLSSNNRIWIGSDGPNTFTFINGARDGASMILIVWYAEENDDQASFMNARRPEISYSLPETGSAVEISVANGVPGGWSVLYDRATTLTEYGQVSNTFGEFSTGVWATVDVSRLVNMSGDAMTVRVYGGEESARKPTAPGLKPVCVSDLVTCAYACRGTQVNSCGATGSYDLINCGGPNAVSGTDASGNPNGGCQGWSFGGHIEVVMT